jgi:hypothetical protein
LGVGGMGMLKTGAGTFHSNLCVVLSTHLTSNYLKY